MDKLPAILEAVLLTAEKPLTLQHFTTYFTPDEAVTPQLIRQALDVLQERCAGHSFELVETASGYRLQTRADFQPWLARHHEEKPPTYSRAFLETLALIAWRQPITRAEIEDIRGVGINSQIIKTLLEREWIRVLGRKEVPGRPEMLGTTRQFLDYFNLKSLDALPDLGAMQDIDTSSLSLAIAAPQSSDDKY